MSKNEFTAKQRAVVSAAAGDTECIACWLF